jgi:hypothetical protein
MSSPDKNMGPRVGQTVLYSSNGVAVEPGMITAINSTGTVSISSFNGATVSARTTVGYNGALNTANSWAYPDQL